MTYFQKRWTKKLQFKNERIKRKITKQRGIKDIFNPKRRRKKMYMRERKKITRKTASRAAKAVISAQETIFPHFLWIRPLRSSMVFNASGLMPPLACSPFSSFPPFASSSNDPSHPYTHIKINIVPFSSCMKKI